MKYSQKNAMEKIQIKELLIQDDLFVEYANKPLTS